MQIQQDKKIRLFVFLFVWFFYWQVALGAIALSSREDIKDLINCQDGHSLALWALKS